MPKVEEVEEYIKELEGAYQQSEATNKQLQQQAQMSMYGAVAPNEENLIRWQLDLKEDLDRIYHLLKGHQLTMGEHGEMIFTEPTDPDLKPFNEFGVQTLMNIMAFYLNRNTLLSNYDLDTINWKVLDFGNEVADLIHNRYQEMGMDTPEKIKMYPMMVKELVDTVHSAYLRALRGGERESLRTARSVQQMEPLGGMNDIRGMPKRRFNLFKPRTWSGI